MLTRHLRLKVDADAITRVGAGGCFFHRRLRGVARRKPAPLRASSIWTVSARVTSHLRKTRGRRNGKRERVVQPRAPARASMDQAEAVESFMAVCGATNREKVIAFLSDVSAVLRGLVFLPFFLRKAETSLAVATRVAVVAGVMLRSDRLFPSSRTTLRRPLSPFTSWAMLTRPTLRWQWRNRQCPSRPRTCWSLAA
jgi:hypothetical protein